ncbi:MAG: carboxylating nicotinate-nucleotide diphosphorylase [Nitrospirae bacterium]|nr:carboxylating nicotinate-nucleotide diphosphorylase [Nitrospirota bacterium]
MISREVIKEFIKGALSEDIGTGDITTELTIPDNHISLAKAIAKEDFILAGLPIFIEVFRFLSERISYEPFFSDGDPVSSGETIARIKGPTRALLMGERVALNILQRLSGIATLTHSFVEKVEGTGVKILDTRKTTPAMRLLEKYAVKVGGAQNHRFGLYDGILIKDNHIEAAGGIKKAIALVREAKPHLLKIEVEVKNLNELKEAIEAGADIVMLDNMGVEQIRSAVALARERRQDIVIEVSGGVRLENVRELALTGVDYISVGALTHSAKAVDISMKIERIP